MAPAVTAEQLADQSERHKTASCFTVGKSQLKSLGLATVGRWVARRGRQEGRALVLKKDKRL